MHPDEFVGPDSPADELLTVARRRASEWLGSRVLAAAATAQVSIASDDPEFRAVVDDAVQTLLDDLAVLLGADVDDQRTNPLSLFRDAVIRPTGWLLERGARPPVAGRSVTDPFISDRFPDDVFGLGPATWSDIHPDLHGPGIAWGAWKAMTVLTRRREEGLR